MRGDLALPDSIPHRLHNEPCQRWSGITLQPWDCKVTNMQIAFIKQRCCTPHSPAAVRLASGAQIPAFTECTRRCNSEVSDWKRASELCSAQVLGDICAGCGAAFNQQPRPQRRPGPQRPPASAVTMPSPQRIVPFIKSPSALQWVAFAVISGI